MSLSYGFCLGEEDSLYGSAQFSQAFQAIVGDGVCPSGGKLQVSTTETMKVSLATGFALLVGRWFRSDEAISLTVQPADNHFDRYDAIVVRADLKLKSISVIVAKGNAAVVPQKYTPARNHDLYEIVLCHIFVRMGTTQILSTDITDTRADKSLCGMIMQLSDISEKVLRVYRFLELGIDKRIDALTGQANAIIKKGDDVIASIGSAMTNANISKAVGEIEILYKSPKPEKEWLRCDGKPIPAEYETLHKLLNGRLPDLTKEGRRFCPWNFAGSPKSTEEQIKMR